MVTITGRLQHPFTIFLSTLYNRNFKIGSISAGASLITATSAFSSLHQQRDRCGGIATFSTAAMSKTISGEESGDDGGNEQEIVSPGTDPLERITGYLNAKDAFALDVELMSQPGFSLEQLMELAGLSVAEAVYKVVFDDMDGFDDNEEMKKETRIVVVCGPGNNGGDGLVAARHLVHFGFRNVVVVYPKRSSKTHFVNLVAQCENVGLTISNDLPDDFDGDKGKRRLIVVDAVFGFSFRGEPREPFASVLNRITELQRKKKKRDGVLVISVDVVSGWDVDKGDVSGTGFVPDVLVSLTAPKDCSKFFTGRHFVGGRFLTDALAKKYNIQMPPYPGTSQVMEITTSHQKVENAKKEYDWGEDYQRYLEEKGVSNDKVGKGMNEDWAVEYAKHCEEKERADEQERR